MGQRVVLTHLSLDGRERDGTPGSLGEDVFEYIASQLYVDRVTSERTACGDSNEGAFEFPDVGRDAISDERKDVVRDVQLLDLDVPPENSDAGLEIGRLDIGDEPHLETTPQSLLELLYVLRWFVRGKDDLLAGLLESIEGVEELLLGTLLAFKELYVVNEKNVVRPVLSPETVDPLLVSVSDRVDEIVRELLAGHVLDLQMGVTSSYVVPYRL